jgi:RimJ/RimL family protein N-acetyltransferase
MIKLTSFHPSDFDTFISWINTEELLVTIAGRYFTYPLTSAQLERYLEDEKSISFSVIDTAQNKIIGHSEIILNDDNICKLYKVIVGDTSNRGKGIGGMLINELLKYSFEKLNAHEVELNVYDWNIAGIKCYEKAGFIFTEKLQSTEINGKIWIAKNMTINKERWMSMQANENTVAEQDLA